MMTVDEIINKILEVPAYDREELVLAIVRGGLLGHIDSNALMGLLATDYKSELEEDAHFLDEYCDAYGFECLVEELASRREEEL